MATSTRHIGFCPVCEHKIKVRSGKLVHHGYKRPGIGYILGDCFGVDMPPHEVSPNTAKFYLASVIEPELRAAENAVAFLEDPPFLMFHKQENGRWVYVGHTPVMEKRRRDEVSEWEWERQLSRSRSDAAGTLRSFIEERDRLVDLVVTWQPLPLQTVDEEVAKQAEAKAVRTAKVQEDREQKSAEALVLLRASIDRAVKKRDAFALHDLFTRGWYKVSEPLRIGYGSPTTLDRNDVLRLLDRDEVWRALGWMDGEAYGGRDVDWRILTKQAITWPEPRAGKDPELERVKAERAGRTAAKRERELAARAAPARTLIDKALATLQREPVGSHESQMAVWQLARSFWEANRELHQVSGRMSEEEKRAVWFRAVDRDFVWLAFGWLTPDGRYVKAFDASEHAPVPPELL